ncbi:hypothetical protein GLAREA_04867 [Glarea lozoyensis ATCC 20868]|uniref:DUF6594 domain-containing protein n=1 Tax=Glarea lozoyensis (strain ATCC 20868 / MF5171) TaxID=1116229 RepID=S3D7T4_GLAL2|nr:uncharacterized protein GLAREA_04867 [Glarea lozoyensis ATCC 20868]EPE28076.1 hypothetical protein GLAREA_04867 [Glarea lozoyensis ATCC 20868]
MNSSPAAVEGYPKLACHMDAHPESSIYRRFGSLNHRNLLYLQAELVHLETQLLQLEHRDKHSQVGSSSIYSKDWYWLSCSAEDGNSEQLQTVRIIRKKLKQYNDAVIQQSTIQNLPYPRAHALKVLWEWLRRPSMGNRGLVGLDHQIWGGEDSPANHNIDLLSLDATKNADVFSNWFSEKLLVFYHIVIGSRFQRRVDIESGVCSYQGHIIHRCISCITVVVASLIPVLAIAVLFCVSSMKIRLLLVALFTVIFTMSLTILTSAKKAEIFAATSTFAAVQVVFISTQQLSG